MPRQELESEHNGEAAHFEELGRLLKEVKALARRNSRDAAGWPRLPPSTPRPSPAALPRPRPAPHYRAPAGSRSGVPQEIMLPSPDSMLPGAAHRPPLPAHPAATARSACLSALDTTKSH